MATTTESSTLGQEPAPTVRLAPGTYPTMEEAISHAQRAVELAGGGTPLFLREPNGVVRVAGIVMESSPSSNRVEVPSSARFDENGRLVPEPEAVRLERLRRLQEAFAAIEAEGTPTPEEAESELEELREIDRERVARGERPLFEGI